jgi:hypothetical protein
MKGQDWIGLEPFVKAYNYSITFHSLSGEHEYDNMALTTELHIHHFLYE